MLSRGESSQCIFTERVVDIAWRKKEPGSGHQGFDPPRTWLKSSQECQSGLQYANETRPLSLCFSPWHFLKLSRNIERCEVSLNYFSSWREESSGEQDCQVKVPHPKWFRLHDVPYPEPIYFRISKPAWEEHHRQGIKLHFRHLYFTN
jgi:hypothetical protein